VEGALGALAVGLGHPAGAQHGLAQVARRFFEILNEFFG
jgi:hypothetical protein